MRTPTLCVHQPAGSDPHGAVAPPVYQTATFRQPKATEFGEYDYTRTRRARSSNGSSLLPRSPPLTPAHER